MNRYYAAWRALLRVLVPILTRIRVEGLENIPKTGAAILVSNHISNTDPPIMIAYVKRHVRFIIKIELYDHLIYRIIFPPGEPIPIRRGTADRVALRKAEEVLKAGGVVGIYPEGTRNRSGATQEAQMGAVFLAQRTGAPIIPVAISGTEGILSERFPWFRRVPVRMTFGEPFTLADLSSDARPSREVLTQGLMQRIAVLLPPRYRGVYGGIQELGVGNREMSARTREISIEDRIPPAAAEPMTVEAQEIDQASNSRIPKPESQIPEA